MGGSNSGRWGWTSKKDCVEDCLRLSTKIIAKYAVGVSGWVRWGTKEDQRGKIGFHRLDEMRVRLSYSVNGQDVGYLVEMNTTPLPWGKVRFWWTCPGAGCGRRVAHLYLAPGSKYFLCRHCYHLTYRSCQDEGSQRGAFGRLAGLMSSDFPGITWKEVKCLLDM